MRATTIVPVVLPYYNLLSGRRGHQFGLPSKEGGTDILVLFDNGDTEKISNPIRLPANLNKGKPPQPQWAWVYAKSPGDDGLHFHRVHRPNRRPGSSPITKKTVWPRPVYSPSASHEKGAPYFVNRPITTTPRGRDYFRQMTEKYARSQLDFPVVPADLPHDLHVPEQFARRLVDQDLSGEVLKVDIALGVTPFASVWTKGNALLGVQPEMFAIQQGLWTSHIVAAAIARLEIAR